MSVYWRMYVYANSTVCCILQYFCYIADWPAVQCWGWLHLLAMLLYLTNMRVLKYRIVFFFFMNHHLHSPFTLHPFSSLLFYYFSKPKISLHVTVCLNVCTFSKECLLMVHVLNVKCLSCSCCYHLHTFSELWMEENLSSNDFTKPSLKLPRFLPT